MKRENVELTAESRRAAGTQKSVDMIDPDGNVCAVSLRHGNARGIVATKLAAGWRFAPPSADAALAAVEAPVEAADAGGGEVTE